MLSLHLFIYLLMRKATRQLCTPTHFIPGNISGKYEEAAAQLHTWDRDVDSNEAVRQQGIKAQGSLQQEGMLTGQSKAHACPKARCLLPQPL